MRFVRAYFLLSLCFLSSPGSAQSALFGRYVGVLRHEKLGRDQLAKLDLIESREGDGAFELVGILTLHFGDFQSREYVSYHFDNVRYDVIHHRLIFDQVDQQVSLSTEKFGNGELVGKLRSVFGGNAGTLILRQNKGTEPQNKGTEPLLPLIEPVNGEYVGHCSAKTIDTLQIQTTRSPEDTTKVGNPFAAYEIRAQLAQHTPGQKDVCIGLNTGRPCTIQTFRSGSYNFFKNRLFLFGNAANFTCVPETWGMTCGKCAYKRVSGETAAPRQLAPSPARNAFPATSGVTPAGAGSVEAVQGEYHGFVHHEYLDRYQAATLNLLAYPEANAPVESPRLRISAVASLHFGIDEDSIETISYRFQERAYPVPFNIPVFLFRRPEADVDALLQVTSIGSGVVRGVWYSILFGRVGSFELRRDGSVPLPKGARVMEPIGGYYQSSEWQARLLVNLTKAPQNSENPFFPLTFAGNFYALGGYTPSIPIQGGSYDFYTGRIGLSIGSGDRVVSGVRVQRSELGLKWASGSLLSPIQEHEPQRFKLIEE